MIDCDTLALADPTLDLANLLVHLEFRGGTGGARRVGEQAVREMAAEQRVPLQRMAAHATSTRLLLAFVYAVRPQWQELAARWFRDAAQQEDEAPSSCRRHPVR